MSKLDLTLVQKFHRAVNNYNNRYHSTIQMTPLEAKGTNPMILGERINQAKRKQIHKLNKNREEYVEVRKILPIKNYKRNYYKNEPRYRIKKLERGHPMNTKRPRKFTGDSTNTHHPRTGNNPPDRSNINDITLNN